MEGEQAKAQTAKPEEVTLFDKIVSGAIPCDKIFEDDKCLDFRDIAPVAKTHFLVIPKNRDGLSQLQFAEDRHTALLGHLMVTAAKLAKQENLGDGFRLVVNDGKNGCQSVYHLHIHVIGGEQLTWPPGCPPQPKKED